MAATDSSKVPGGGLGFWLGIAATAAIAAGVVAVWPADEGRTLAAGDAVAPTVYSNAPAIPELPDLPDNPTEVPGATAQLFVDGPSSSVQEVLAAAGNPELLHEIAVYPSYLFVTYQAGDGLVRSAWRDGAVQLDTPAAIGSYDLAELFTDEELDLALDLLPSMVADAPTRYPMPTVVTHVLIDRFLPFDDRVLVRVYAIPTEGDPSEAGYVSYTTAGTFVDVCC